MTNRLLTETGERTTRRSPLLLGRILASVLVVILGLLSVYGPSNASASSLSITTSGNIFTKTYTPCTTAALTATASGTASGSPATTYTALTIGDIPAACNSKSIAMYAYNSSGDLLISSTGSTSTGTTGTVSFPWTAGYNAAQIAKVYVFVDTWGIQTTWNYTAPTSGPYTCVELTAWPGNSWEAPSTYGTPTGNTCTVSYTSFVSWGGTPPKHFNLYFTVSGASTGNWRVTINFADPYFEGLLPTNISGNGNPLPASGYSCSQLPIYVGQANLNWASSTRNSGYVSGSSVGGSGSICN